MIHQFLSNTFVIGPALNALNGVTLETDAGFDEGGKVAD